MKTLRLILLAALCSTGHLLYAQNTGLPPFRKIHIEDNSKITLHIGSPQSVVIENENASDITLDVDNNTLYVRGKNSRLKITLPELQGINIMGVGSLECEDTIRGNSMEISIAGTGKAELVLDVQELDTKISGMGKLELEGEADNAQFQISGSGKIDALELKMNKAKANISGVGKIQGDVVQELDLTISGSGSFFYRNKPPVVNARISGIGKYGQTSENSNGHITTVNIGDRQFVVAGTDHDRDFKFMWDRDSLNNPPQKSRSHWGGLDIGFNQLITDGKLSTNLPDDYDYLELNSGKSVNVNINLFYHDFQIYKRKILFTTGIGLTLNNYRFSDSRTLIADTNRTVAGFDFDKNGRQIKYTKNKLAVNYITIPLLLQWNSREEFNNSFHVAAGLLLSYKFNSHLKLVYREDGDREKTKRHDEFNINPFRYDFTMRLGYEYYTLYASYSLGSLFKENRGPSLHPFQVGINLFGW